MDELQEIESKLVIGWANDVVRQQDYLLYLSTQKARINELKSDAEKQFISKLGEWIKIAMHENFKQYEYRDHKEVYTKDEQCLVNRLDRISGSIETQCRSLMVLISYEKEAMKLSV